MISHDGGGVRGAVAARQKLDTTLADIERICKLEQAIVRNLLITQRYHDLTGSLAGVIGQINANWATFATWASKTAGQSIRGEEVPRELTQILQAEAKLQQHFERLTRAFSWVPFLKLDIELFDVARAIIDEVSRQIALGNLRVFAELAPFFARFADEFADPEQRTQANLEKFLEHFKPGGPENDGQDLLKLAFRAYFEAAAASDQKHCAELVLYANLLIGLHEQTRLQPNIAAALNAPLSDRVYTELRSGVALLLRPLFQFLFRGPLKSFRENLQEVWERVATRFLMRLSLPGGGSISLGEDVRGRFPKDLDPLTYAVLVQLVQRYDANLATTAGSAAVNWTVLSNRMAFITDLFRCRQQDGLLFDPPFTSEQRALFEKGQIPPGPL
ncbi:MAG TPA: hypothetical protein VIM73_11570 [Polyangiaceae bacterium]